MELIPPRNRLPLLHVVIDRGTGPTVILIHGIASSSVTFQNVVPLIADRHRCIAIDLLGFGESPVLEGSDYSLTEHAAAIKRTVESIRPEAPLTLVGHSMGALIAARLAAKFPRRIGKVVLVSPPIYMAPAELTDDLDRRVMDFYLKAYQYLRANKDFTLRNARIVERLLPIRKALDLNERTWTPFIKSLQNSIESQTTISDLASIAAPVDLIYGSMDQFRSEGVLKIVSRMTGVSVHRVRGSDHLIGRRLARVVAEAIG